MLFAFALLGLNILVIALLLLMVKTVITGYLRNKLICAIGKYNHSVLMRDEDDMVIPFDCLEPYYCTLFRLNNWGTADIVSDDIYQRIEPFLT